MSTKMRPETDISIHALRGEGDNFWQAKSPTSTISIHALRGEGDIALTGSIQTRKYISIHALRGEGDV